jgi:hypothetical protein
MDVPAEIRGLLEGLQRRIDKLEAWVAELEGEIADLRAENAYLKRPPGLDSSTRSKPPSSVADEEAGELREPSDRSRGQQSHKGETLKRIADPGSDT